MTTVQHETIIIEIENTEASDLYADMLDLEVEQDENLAAMFHLRLAMRLQSDGVWTYLEDERLKLWKKVVISAGFEGDVQALITAYITHVRPEFDPDPNRCVLEIWGMDESVLMDREEKLKCWPNKKDSDIAREIFNNDYRVTPVVEDTQVIHDEAVSTIIQRETDIQFLRRLALRNGYECYVENGHGYFRPPQVDADAQPVLAAHFGDDTTLERFNIEVNGLTPTRVGMFQVDRSAKETLSAQVEEAAHTSLGADNAQALLGIGMRAAQTFVAMNVASGTPEMTALCQGLYEEGHWFISAQGEVSANLYGHVLHPHAPVTVKGVGARHSGVYYVIHVTHHFSQGGYKQTFRAKRNAWLPTGAEDFGGDAGFF